MKIAIFTNNYLPNPYGVSTSVDGFRKGLIKRGHEVVIFAPEWPGCEGENNPQIIRYPSFDLPTKVPFSLALPFSPEIDEYIDMTDFDIIHAQHPNILGVQALRWSRVKHVPLVFTWHSLYDRYAHYAPAVIPEKIAMRWVMHNAQTYAHAADHVIFPTQTVYDAIGHHEIKPEKVSIIPSGVDEELFVEPDPKPLKQELGIPENAPVLVSVSRITKEKNVLFLAEAVAHYLRQDVQAFFIMAGEGDLVQDITSICENLGVADRVVFPGKVARDAVKNYLAIADLFVYASTSETQGTILTEAMYVGVPVVAVSSQGVDDVVVSGETGLLVGEDVEMFAYVIVDLMSNPEKRHAMRGASQKLARSRFTIDACSAKMESLYKKLINKS